MCFFLHLLNKLTHFDKCLRSIQAVLGESLTIVVGHFVDEVEELVLLSVGEVVREGFFWFSEGELLHSIFALYVK